MTLYFRSWLRSQGEIEHTHTNKKNTKKKGGKKGFAKKKKKKNTFKQLKGTKCYQKSKISDSAPTNFLTSPGAREVISFSFP